MINTKKNHTSGKVVILSLRKIDFLWNSMHSHLLVKRPINKTVHLQGSPSVRSPNISSLAGFSPKSWEVGKQLCFTNSVWATTSSTQAGWSWDSNPGVCDSKHSITNGFIRTHVDGSYGGCVYLTAWGAAGKVVYTFKKELGKKPCIFLSRSPPVFIYHTPCQRRDVKGNVDVSFVFSHTEATWQHRVVGTVRTGGRLWGAAELPVGPGCFLLEKKHLSRRPGTSFTYNLKFQLVVGLHFPSQAIGQDLGFMFLRPQRRG